MRLVKNKVYSMLGLAMRARKLVSGEFSTDKAVKDRKAHVVIVAHDASGNTKKQFRDGAAFYHVPYYEYGTKDELGHAIGKQERASIAVTDIDFAKAVIKILEEI